MEYRTTALRTEDEIVRALVLPVIAAIPMMIAVADIRRRRRIMTSPPADQCNRRFPRWPISPR